MMSGFSLKNIYIINRLFDIFYKHFFIIICIYCSDVLRAKEYERERRLRLRELRKQKALEAAAA